MEGKLYKIDEVIQFIEQGKLLSLAGDERALSTLPKGNWIAGTIPYFMNVDKGMFNQNMIFVNELSSSKDEFTIKTYDENNIDQLTEDSYSNGYTMLIIPPFTKIHETFALKAQDFQDLFDNPVIGWIAGMDLNSSDVAMTYNGDENQTHKDKAVAIHVKLPKNKLARLEIVNIFSPDNKSDEIQFLSDGFACSDCLINGEKKSLATYIQENSIDIKSPIISNYSGALINVSFKEVNSDKNEVSFYAPVFKDRIYKFSKSIDNYIAKFELTVPVINEPIEFSCNCILNYLYGDLENKNLKGFAGPVTFGEIGYQLLNQTLTYLVIEDQQ